MTEPIVSYSESDGIATIAMDDGKVNALSPHMIAQLNGALDQAEAEAKALILTGRAGTFSGGFDLRHMMSGPDGATSLVNAGGELLMRLYTFPLPVVVACTGHALAAGVLLVAIGDTRIGAQGPFKVGLNEVQNGMPVPIFAHELARDRLLPSELFSAVVQARIYDPEGAVHAGWLDRTVAPEQLVAEARTEATKLAKLPKTAYGVSKCSLRQDTVSRVRATLTSNIGELVRLLGG